MGVFLSIVCLSVRAPSSSSRPSGVRVFPGDDDDGDDDDDDNWYATGCFGNWFLFGEFRSHLAATECPGRRCQGRMSRGKVRMYICKYRVPK